MVSPKDPEVNYLFHGESVYPETSLSLLLGVSRSTLLGLLVSIPKQEADRKYKHFL